MPPKLADGMRSCRAAAEGGGADGMPAVDATGGAAPPPPPDMRSARDVLFIRDRFETNVEERGGGGSDHDERTRDLSD